LHKCIDQLNDFSQQYQASKLLSELCEKLIAIAKRKRGLAKDHAFLSLQITHLAQEQRTDYRQS
jgi:hypothetical protein